MRSNKDFIKIGLTGGIGSGKTTVAKIIEKLGFPVFYSDLVAKSLMTENDGVVQSVVKIFGEQAYVNGRLNKSFLAQLAFSNPRLLNALNEIIHPEVWNAYSAFCEDNKHKKLIFNEAAILFETGAYKRFDYNVLVTAPEEIRIRRVMERDRLSEVQVKARINNQWSDEKKIPLADFVIFNYDRSLEPQIEFIVQRIMIEKNLA
jgi:dephospho-CoA kinase